MNYKILIVIPGYYERFQINTIESAIKRAKYPENISFAISHHEDHIVNIDQIHNKVSRYIIPKGKKVGVNKPRSILSQFRTDEDFILMVDSHVIFMPNWDEQLILDYLDRLDTSINKNIIISGSFGNTIHVGHLEYNEVVDKYFNNDNFFNEIQNNFIYEFYIDKGKFEATLSEPITDANYQAQMRNIMPTMTHASGQLSRHDSIPHMQNIFSGGFCFFPSRWFAEYSISQKIFFSGDQEETAINIYTSGYDVWMPRKKYHIHMSDHRQETAERFEYRDNVWYATEYYDIYRDQEGVEWFLQILRNMRYDDNKIRPRTIKGFFDFHKLDENLYK